MPSAKNWTRILTRRLVVGSFIMVSTWEEDCAGPRIDSADGSGDLREAADFEKSSLKGELWRIAEGMASSTSLRGGVVLLPKVKQEFSRAIFLRKDGIGKK